MITVTYGGNTYNVQDYQYVFDYLTLTHGGNTITDHNGDLVTVPSWTVESETSRILLYNASITSERYSYAVYDLSQQNSVISYINSDNINVNFPKILLSVLDKQNMQSYVSFSSDLVSNLKSIYNVQ